MSVHDVSFHVLPMQTRFPFQYGIASMTALPHLFVTVRGECGGVPLSGVSSEGLPPKWFTKDPETTFEDDLPQMLEVITVAASNLTRAATGTFFDHWKELYYRQESWARENGVPPLLANLGVSLMERALLDGFCRAMKVSLAEALRSNVLGLALGEVRDELAGNDPADLLPAAPLSRIVARHTVGLGDPLTTAALLAERALVARLGGGCQIPIGALATVTADELDLQAAVTSLDGSRRIRGRGRGDAANAVGLGRRVADTLLAEGAQDILDEARRSPTGPGGQR